MISNFGLILLIIGIYSLFVMNVTKTMPFRIPWGRWQADEDPSSFRRYLLVYGALAGVGALLFLTRFL